MDKYEIFELIGEGGMSRVYKGRDRSGGELVAIKVIATDKATTPVLLKRFEQEFLTASRLDHTNIVRSFDYGRHNNTPYLVMEYVPGQSLGERIERSGRLPVQEAIDIFTQVAAALDYAHQNGVIHRDVKPDNILFTADGRVKLIDLGLIKQLATDHAADLNLTRQGQGLGTPNFMAPEQFKNAKNIDLRCDIYGLAATLYMAVTGELPFAAANAFQCLKKKACNELVLPRQLVPTLSEQVERAIMRAMSLDPTARPESCAEFVKELGDPRSTQQTAAAAGATGLSTAVYLPQQPSQLPTGADSSQQPAPPSPKAEPKTAGPDWGPWALAATLALGTALAAYLIGHFR
jgi:serine/threonine protein kinase